MQPHRHVVLLLGAPGAGKGTQARFLGEALGVPHVASGDLLREHRRRGTPLGRAAQGYMDRGDLVPDELVVDMVIDRLARFDADHGALLDGFPRTLPQAEVLDSRLAAGTGSVRAAIYLEVAKKTLIERLAGRWICGTCQATYHERFSPPQVEGICDVCGSTLSQRPDDRREVVENRVEVYLRETLPVIDHYHARGVVHRVDGDRPIERVRAALCVALGGAVLGLRRPRWHLFVAQEPIEGATRRRRAETVCGHYIDSLSGRTLGDDADFEARPCRECLHELRPHQAPKPTTPLVETRGEAAE